MTEELAHVGTPRHSGRYPWGSGKDPHQRNKSFIDYVSDLERSGMSATEVAKAVGMNTTELRAQKTIAKNAIKKEQITQATKLRDKGMSYDAIAKQLGVANESSVRAMLAPGEKEKSDHLTTIANMLKDEVETNKYIDIGAGTENYLGISQTKLNTAVAMLKVEGYRVDTLKTEQLGTGLNTKLKILSAPGTEYRDIIQNQDKIRSVAKYSNDNGKSFIGIEKPVSVDAKRIQVRYGPEGGAQMDGVIQLRRGVPDISLGNSRYAQVRIAVDGTHYLKGMAMYADDLPNGVDIRFNTNKDKKSNKLDAMKPMEKLDNGKIDTENPFGSSIKVQRKYIDKNGKEQLSALNILQEEGDWENWARRISSQVLSKQPPALAKQQLDLTFNIKKAEFDEIMALTNPAVKRKLLQSFADDADSSAVKLKAAGLPRTAQHVILPFNSIKDTEVYAPQYRNGETVVLIRHPHGGRFEIPELTVNNRNKDAKAIIGNARDAVGINHKVAARLSGADFDGDTVLVIPNKKDSKNRIQTHAPLEALKDFDPQTAYKGYEGMPKMSAQKKQHEMGLISNLITDMTIRGASMSKIARAVRHSMVVIDAEKHGLDYKQSAIDNGIADLKREYQGKASSGATTLISKASSDYRVPERKPRTMAKGGPIDPKTGRKMYEPTGATYINKQGKTIVKTTKTTPIAEAIDAFSLSSGTPIEAVYATHANRLKSIANEARKEYLKTKPVSHSPSAKITYAKEVASLKASLNVALKNAPLERQAQLLAKTIVSAKIKAKPGMEKKDIKKLKGQALTQARIRVGAVKKPVKISPLEWEAIQSGAISNNMLEKILANTDIDQVKAYATPRQKTVMVPARLAKAQSMLNAGYTQAEVADSLGISTSTLKSALSSEGG